MRKTESIDIIKALDEEFPDPAVELDYDSDIELLVAAVLSAQCTDIRVNKTTALLFRKYRSVSDYAEADEEEFAEDIKSCGFYRSKAGKIVTAARMIRDRFNSRIPGEMDSLLQLPGIGRKTANLLLGVLYDSQTIVVDTHVKRVAGRLGLTESTNPEKIEIDLQDFLPEEKWSRTGHQILLHGRYICKARKPECERCLLYKFCPWNDKTSIFRN